MSSCRSKSFYLAPGVYRRFSEYELVAVLPDGTFQDVRHRKTISELMKNYPLWDGLVLCAQKNQLTRGKNVGIREAVLNNPAVLERWHVDSRVIEGRRPIGSGYTLHKLSHHGVESVGGVQQAIDSVLPGASPGVKKAARQLLSTHDTRGAYRLSLAVAAEGYLDGHQIANLLRGDSFHEFTKWRVANVQHMRQTFEVIKTRYPDTYQEVIASMFRGDSKWAGAHIAALYGYAGMREVSESRVRGWAILPHALTSAKNGYTINQENAREVRAVWNTLYLQKSGGVATIDTAIISRMLEKGEISEVGVNFLGDPRFAENAEHQYLVLDAILRQVRARNENDLWGDAESLILRQLEYAFNLTQWNPGTVKKYVGQIPEGVLSEVDAMVLRSMMRANPLDENLIEKVYELASKFPHAWELDDLCAAVFSNDNVPEKIVVDYIDRVYWRNKDSRTLGIVTVHNVAALKSLAENQALLSKNPAVREALENYIRNELGDLSARDGAGPGEGLASIVENFIGGGASSEDVRAELLKLYSKAVEDGGRTGGGRLPGYEDVLTAALRTYKPKRECETWEDFYEDFLENNPGIIPMTVIDVRGGSLEASIKDGPGKTMPYHIVGPEYLDWDELAGEGENRGLRMLQPDLVSVLSNPNLSDDLKLRAYLENKTRVGEEAIPVLGNPTVATPVREKICTEYFANENYAIEETLKQGGRATYNVSGESGVVVAAQIAHDPSASDQMRLAALRHIDSILQAYKTEINSTFKPGIMREADLRSMQILAKLLGESGGEDLRRAADKLLDQLEELEHTYNSIHEAEKNSPSAEDLARAQNDYHTLADLTARAVHRNALGIEDTYVPTNPVTHKMDSGVALDLRDKQDGVAAATWPSRLVDYTAIPDYDALPFQDMAEFSEKIDGGDYEFPKAAGGRAALASVRTISSGQELRDNAEYMSNCTSGYARSIAEGTTRIVAVDDAEGNCVLNLSFILTEETRPMRGRVPEEYEALVRQMLERLNDGEVKQSRMMWSLQEINTRFNGLGYGGADYDEDDEDDEDGEDDEVAMLMPYEREVEEGEEEGRFVPERALNRAEQMEEDGWELQDRLEGGR